MVQKFGLYFLILFGFDIFIIQPNFITGNIASRLGAFVVTLFLKFLNTIEVFLVNSY